MDKITKDYLKNLIESVQSDVSEMPSLKQKKTRTDKTPGGKEFIPIPDPEDPTAGGEYAQIVGHYLPTIQKATLMLDCDERESFLQKHGDYVVSEIVRYYEQWGGPEGWKDPESNEPNKERIMQQIAYAPGKCRKKKYPRKDKEYLDFLSGIGFEKRQPEGEKQSVEESNKRVIGKLLREELFGPNVSDIFRKKTIPFLPLEESTMKTLFQGLRGYGDQYSPEFSNDKISFRMFAGVLFENKFDFLETVINNDMGDFESTNTKNLRISRQFNRTYPNYDAGRKMSKKFEGLTPIQKKQARDFEEANIDATVRMDMNIMGDFTGENSFVWNINMSVKLGEKLETDDRLKNGFKTLNDIRVSKNVQLRPGAKENPNFVLMNDTNVKEGFIGVCDELKQRIESISFEELLTYANTSVEGGLDDLGLQESVQKLVDKIVKELTK